MILINPHRFKSKTLKTGLLACWELSETSGDTVFDSHGSYHGANGGVTGSKFTLNQTGLMGKCIQANSTQNNIEMGNVLNIGASDFSIIGWIKTSNYGTFLGKTDMQGVLGDYTFGVNNSGKLYAYLNFQPYHYDHNFLSPNAFPKNAWAFGALTVDRDGYARMYENGAEVANNNVSGHASVNMVNPYALSLGSHRVYGFYQNTCQYLDQVAIWNRVLTVSEIVGLYNSGNGLPYTEW